MNKYELVVMRIQNDILYGNIRQDERLPSIRSLAEKLSCNKSTIIRAYRELEMNHIIYSIPKSGYYLVERKNEDYNNTSLIDFAEVLPDPKLLPYREFNHCINRAVDLYKDSLFTYGDSQGLKSLRKALVDHFSEYEIYTSEERIFITSGSQQALSILARMNFPNGKKDILVEEPTYSLILKLIELNGDRVIGIKRDHNGIDLNELESIFKGGNIKFFYTIPRFHNPLGTSYTERDKRKIVELAEKYEVFIVEDDYLSDIDTNKKAFPMHYYDISGRVIYLKSFSKAFMPGIRIGAVVLSNGLKAEFLKYKRCQDLNTSVLDQGALEIFLNSGMYKNHIKKARLEYKKKMGYLKACLKGIDIGGAECIIPETGFFVWMGLPDKINMSLLVRRLEERNVLISPGNIYFTGSNVFDKGFRICISKLSESEIKTGVRILFEEINKLLNR